MIVISTLTFDLNGSVEIHPRPGEGDGESRRRVVRARTLDQGVVVSDGGYSEGDRDLIYTWKPISRAHNDAVDRLVRLYDRVHVSTASGVYLAVPESFNPTPTQSTITLLVIEKVSE